MNTSITSEPIVPQSTGVPVDYRDPSHPHFPGDLDCQPFVRDHYKYAPFISRKSVWIIGAIFLILASFAVATVTGIKIGTSQIQQPPPANMTKVETIFGTTEVLATTLFPLPKRPNATTITTTTLLPVPSAPPMASSKFIPENAAQTSVSSVNWFPVAPAFSWTPPTTTIPAKPDPPKETGGKCMSVGNWGTEGTCKEKCDEMDGKTWKTAKCESDGKYWKCVVCPFTGGGLDGKLG